MLATLWEQQVRRQDAFFSTFTHAPSGEKKLKKADCCRCFLEVSWHSLMQQQQNETDMYRKHNWLFFCFFWNTPSNQIKDTFGWLKTADCVIVEYDTKPGWWNYHCRKQHCRLPTCIGQMASDGSLLCHTWDISLHVWSLMKFLNFVIKLIKSYSSPIISKAEKHPVSTCPTMHVDTKTRKVTSHLVLVFHHQLFPEHAVDDFK